ncbi:iron ABC transporter permease [Cytobacillus sp. IB215316]|uniref:FecCD family ABC transporter permease n=1 Tax=Cytobacillus sp. IB215316 TaxID=3097354 RepID=UPI002A129BCD|nr:iron ABC transporter permease [Cytobacillus sp. IB215316]MDX8361984.1 iron ABC transporter permease [Cytobacillus sp. IB215316]
MLLTNNRGKLFGLITSLCILLLCIGLSIILGYTDTGVQTAIEAFQQFDGSNEHIIIQQVRLPRALIAAVIGSSLAIAGALMQALMKNPLASPDIIGINAGASFFIVVALMVFSVNSLQAYTWIAFAGAAFASCIVYVFSSSGTGLTPMKLTLAGAAIAALFSSLTQGLLVMDESALDQALFWLAGSVQGRDLDILFTVYPYLIGATVLAFIISPKINVLTMGEDVARGLGLRTGVVNLTMTFCFVLLAGGSVAVAGPIGFIGIIIPHIVRTLVGNDFRWILPYCGVLGGILLLLADIGARYVIMPEEVPVGVMTAFIGTPFFIYIARKGVHSA